MNPSSSKMWDNPPPPGTELSDGEEFSNSSSKKDGLTPGRPIDRIDPFLKNPEYIEYEKKISSERSKFRSRSRSPSHRRRRSRSRSCNRSKAKRPHRRSRSRSKRRSRSGARTTKPREKRRSRRTSTSKHSRSRSRSRSKSRSRSHRSHKSKHERSKRSRSHHRSTSKERVYSDTELNAIDMKIESEEEEEDEPDPVKENVFKNDGSFLDMFKKMQEQQQQVQETATNSGEVKKLLPAFGKRRGGKVLKTGLVQKSKVATDDDNANAQDAWSVYMKEVRRYKEACCDDDSKTRPLVK